MITLKDNPTVSVIIPTYNRAHLVGRAIQSVLNQTYQDKEDDKRLLAERYFNCGAALCINEDITQFNEGRRCLQEATKICPLNLSYILASLIALSGPALFHNRPLRKLLKLYWRFRKSFLKIKRYKIPPVALCSIIFWGKLEQFLEQHR